MKNKSITMFLLTSMICSNSITTTFADVIPYGSDDPVMYQTVTDKNDDKSLPVDVKASIRSRYIITLPKTMTVNNGDNAYTVNVKGDLANDENIIVVPDETVSLASEGKKSVVGDISQEKQSFDYVDAAKTSNGKLVGTDADGNIAIDGLTAGHWDGVFYFNVKAGKHEPIHEHKYTSSIVKNPTCTENGLKKFTCENGDDEYTEDIPALGHKYGKPTYKWSDDKSTCTATRVCANDASHVETETVNTTSEITKPATCENTGIKTFTATFDNDAFEKQTSTSNVPATGHKYNDGVVIKAPTCTENGVKKFTCEDGDNSYTEDIPALGHKYGKPTYKWSDDKSTCTATRVCANDASHVETETVNTTSEITKKATCEETGTKTFTATFDNNAFEKQTSTSNVPATGHHYGAPTYTWNNDKSTCTAKRVCKDDGKTETETVNTTSQITKPATCETSGVKTFTAAFKNPAFSTQTATSVIPATGHNYEAPTYTWNNDKSTCTAKRVCKDDGKTETETIKATNVVTKPATCENTGIKTFTAAFKNPAFSTQTATSVIPVTGHHYEAPTYTWSNDKSTCTAKRVCKDDGKTETETVNTTNVVTKPATCENTGIKTFTATFKNPAFSTQTTTSAIPATGHNYGMPTYTWSNDGLTCTAKRVCTNDSKDVETETITATSQITKQATCENTGVKTFTATFKNPAFSTQTITSTIPATGHHYGTPTYTWNKDKSTCTAKRVCKDDGKTETETVNTTNVVTKSATCENTGIKTFTATFKNPAFSTQTATSVIPATGHNYGTPTYTWSDDKSTCTAKRVCKDDGKTETETINATNVVTKPATCENTGIKTFTATFKNPAFATQTTTSVIPVTGHHYGAPTYTWSNDKSTCTAKRVCKDDGKTETETIKATNAITKPATCENTGIKTFTAAFKNPAFSTQTATSVIPATGHNYEAPTYTWNNDKSTCTAKRVCKDDGKTETETIKATNVVTKPATCENTGIKTFTAAFKNPAFATQTTTSVIPVTGHHYEAPTYTWSNDKSTCTAKRVCKADGKTETETIKATNVVTKPATCENTGIKTFTATFKNPAFSTQTITSTIPATGHHYGTPTYTWSNDKSTCTAKRVCQADGKTETETVHTTNVVTKSATCENTGIKTFTATFKNPAFSTQTTTSVIPATGHNYNIPTYTWSNDGLTCTAKRVCANDSKDVETETITATSQITKSATCENTGIKTFTAVFKNPAFTMQTITSNIPATGHHYGTPTYTWNNDKSTCTATRVCTNDKSHVETETVNTTNVVTKAATCKGTGVKTFTAAFKNPAFTTQSSTSDIPANGHHYVNGKCTECGEKDANYIEVGAQSSLADWDYTLDSTTNIIHLTNYKGTKTDIVVYGRYEVGGTTYNTDLSYNKTNKKSPFKDKAESITSIDIKNGVSSTNCKNMFEYMYKISSLDLSNFNTSNVTNMSEMFYDCNNLKALNISGFDTSNVTNMADMFWRCKNLSSLDVSNFNTSNVTNMAGMFNKCDNLKALNVSGFDTSNVTNMNGMFGGCSSLTELDLKNFNTNKVTNMRYMFQADKSLTTLDLSSFDTSNVWTMGEMFDDCTNLTSLDLSSFNTSKVSYMYRMFNNDSKLNTIYVGNNWVINSYTTTTDMFYHCGTSSVTHK